MKHLKLLFYMCLLGTCLCACVEVGRDKIPIYKSFDVRTDFQIPVGSDSAISLLNRIENEIAESSEAEQLFNYLLCLNKTRNKIYLYQISDSLVFPILRYYQENGGVNYPLKAYYCGGSVLPVWEDIPRNLRYWQLSLDNKYERISARARDFAVIQLGISNYYQELQDGALRMYRKVYDDGATDADTVAMIAGLRDVGHTFQDMGRLDSALHYYEMAAGLAEVSGDTFSRNIIWMKLADLSCRRSDFDAAKKYLQDIPVGKDWYSIASAIYHATGERDSAVYCDKKLLEYDDIYERISASWNLANDASERNDIVAAQAYLKGCMHSFDSIWRVAQMEASQKIQSHYDDSIREFELKKLRRGSEKNAFALYWIIVALIVLLICFFIYVLDSRQRRTLLNLRRMQLDKVREEQYKKSLQFIEDLQKKQAELAELLAASDRTNQELIAELEKHQQLLFHEERKAELELDARSQARRALLESDICKRFHALCVAPDKDVTVSQQDWNELEQAVNRFFPAFSERLRQIRRISQYEHYLCLLIKIGISPKQMALLTHHSFEAVTSARRRLYEKFFGEKGTPQQWDEFIESL